MIPSGSVSSREGAEYPPTTHPICTAVRWKSLRIAGSSGETYWTPRLMEKVAASIVHSRW